MLNKATIIGRLGRDPEVRRMNNGNAVVSFSVATDEKWRDKQSGETKSRTEWHNVVIFNEGIGKVAEKYCYKGGMVYVEGTLRTRKWQDKDGADKYTTEIVLENFNGTLKMLSYRDGDGGQQRGGGGGDDDGGAPRQQSSGGGGGSRQQAPGLYDDTDIPF